MAWLTPKTWAFKEKLTAADLNTYVRDNTAWLGSDKPHARATRTTSLSIPNSTDTAVTMPSEDFDEGGMHTTVGADAAKLTVPSGGDGKYQFDAYYRMESGAYTRVVSKILKNGSDEITASMSTPPGSSGAIDSISALIDLVAGDYVELYLNQNAGSSVNCTAAALSAFWVAD